MYQFGFDVSIVRTKAFMNEIFQADFKFKQNIPTIYSAKFKILDLFKTNAKNNFQHVLCFYKLIKFNFRSILFLA